MVPVSNLILYLKVDRRSSSQSGFCLTKWLLWEEENFGKLCENWQKCENFCDLMLDCWDHLGLGGCPSRLIDISGEPACHHTPCPPAYTENPMCAFQHKYVVWLCYLGAFWQNSCYFAIQFFWAHIYTNMTLQIQLWYTIKYCIEKYSLYPTHMNLKTLINFILMISLGTFLLWARLLNVCMFAFWAVLVKLSIQFHTF